MNQNELASLIGRVIDAGMLKKITLSKSALPGVVRIQIRPFAQGGRTMVQLSKFQDDNKVIHENLPADGAGTEIVSLFMDFFKQCNIVTASGNCEAKCNKKGSLYVKNQIDFSRKEITAVASHDKQKRHFLPLNQPVAFLQELGISGPDGRVYDRMAHKLGQINRFLELIDDIKDSLPKDRPIHIFDLCCGKSYLTFAVHHYFTQILHREVEMVGVDLKEDVIDHCRRIIQKLGLKGLSFQCGDILKFEPENKPDMIISLHACNTATDIVLNTAVRLETGIILSSPCCHHELADQLQCDELRLITEYGILRQKLCEISTDALRAQALKISGYQVQLIEFIDPENTPKNLLIRAVKNRGKLDEAKKNKLVNEYHCLCEMLNVNPTLKRLLNI